MDAIVSLLLLSAMMRLAAAQDRHMASFGAVAELASAHPRVFSGENVRLRCSVPDVHKSSWSFQWFRGGVELEERSDTLNLWWAHVKQSGKYSCQGWRDTAVGNMFTLQSPPVEIHVDGGFAILEALQRRGLVGQTLQLACRVRGNPPIRESVLYKDGVEVMSQTGGGALFNLSNASLEDQGSYSCRASWDTDMRTRSVISAATMVEVLEVLTEPVLEIIVDEDVDSAQMMKLVCHVTLNIPAPAPPINYYFYKNDALMGTATSENHSQFKRSSGRYRCRAKVPRLGLFRWSENRRFNAV